MKWSRMKKVREIEDQIKKLKELKKRWSNGAELSDDEMARRRLTLDLLDGVISDLQRRKKEIKQGKE
jgi:hypothetical protein